MVISSRMDYKKWEESIYPELVQRQAPNKLLYLKSKTRSDLISNCVLAGPKVYCVQPHNEEIKVCRGGAYTLCKGKFDMSLYRNCGAKI